MQLGAAHAAVVVSTYNRASLLPRLVEQLGAQVEVPPFEVVIVDNASTDDTPAVLEALRADTRVRLRVERTAVNRGPAAARNRGWRATAARWIAFTDDDCAPDPHWLGRGVAALQRHEAVGVVQGRTDPLPEFLPLRHGVATREIHEVSGFFEGCNLFVRRDALEAVGGFDESIGFCGEETSMGWAILAAGYRAEYCDGALVHHDVAYPPMGWHLRRAWLEGHLVDVARRAPAVRKELFWRPWSFRAEDALLALALAGAAAGARWRPALLVALPYALRRRPPDLSSAGVDIALKKAACDIAALGGLLWGSLRNRRFVI